MNKLDITLAVVVLIISFSLVFLYKNEKGSTAIVTYDGKKVMDIDLSNDNLYSVQGHNGEVKIEVKDNKIRVIEENSPKHLCSKQGFIENNNDMIVCLPNKVVIEVISDKTLVDTVVK